MTEPYHFTGIDATTESGRLALIRMGITPRALEAAYEQSGIREYAKRCQIERTTLTAAAQAWGIRNPYYRRQSDA